MEGQIYVKQLQACDRTTDIKTDIQFLHLFSTEARLLSSLNFLQVQQQVREESNAYSDTLSPDNTEGFLWSRLD